MTRLFPRAIFAAALCGAAMMGGAHAQDAGQNPAPDPSDPIALRMSAMKQVGAAMGAMGAMAKGEAPFDARVAEVSLRAMHAAALGYPSYFPEGSETGANTEAGPKIWTDRAGFDAAAAKFVADTHAAIEAKPADLDGVRAAMGQVGQNCKSCHEGYRVKKN